MLAATQEDFLKILRALLPEDTCDSIELDEDAPRAKPSMLELLARGHTAHRRRLNSLNIAVSSGAPDLSEREEQEMVASTDEIRQGFPRMARSNMALVQRLELSDGQVKELAEHLKDVKEGLKAAEGELQLKNDQVAFLEDRVGIVQAENARRVPAEALATANAKTESAQRDAVAAMKQVEEVNEKLMQLWQQSPPAAASHAEMAAATGNADSATRSLLAELGEAQDELEDALGGV